TRTRCAGSRRTRRSPATSPPTRSAASCPSATDADPTPSAAREPAVSSRVAREEAEEEPGDLLQAARGEVRAIGRAHVAARPDEAVVAPARPVRPQVRAPADPRPADPAGDRLLHEPLHGEAALVGV